MQPLLPQLPQQIQQQQQQQQSNKCNNPTNATIQQQPLHYNRYDKTCAAAHPALLATVGPVGSCPKSHSGLLDDKTCAAAHPALLPTSTTLSVLEEGTIVGIQGLQSLSHLNDTTGIVYGFDVASQRYKIQVEDGTMKKIKRCNLVPEEDLEDDDDYVSALCESERFSGPGDLDILSNGCKVADQPHL